ncbi:MAG TPA: integrin alpha [Phycisphaerae bacterium]|nr:integrin alpha [Phycisphaerae bacterium]
MFGYRGASGLVVAATVLLVSSFPLLTGQGCAGNGVEAIPGGLYENTTGNQGPSFRFTAPVGTVQAEIGDVVFISWTDSDPDDDAQISILLDPDAQPTNGNEVPVATGISEDDPTNSLSLDTGAYGLQPGSYRIIARINDGVNPEVMAAATGQLNLFKPGTVPGNVSPTIVVAEPARSISASEGTSVTITYCGNDRDGGEGGIVADVLIVLDQDKDPLNDLFGEIDYRSSEGSQLLAEICAGDLPTVVNGAVLLACAKDDKCTDPVNGTNFEFVVDATRIPQPLGGEPYKVRVSMWDHTNPPVHAYASGTFSLTGLASGVVDLGEVGRTTAGARLLGFDTGGRLGYTGTSLGDFDGDGADDFIVVARWGRPFERGNVGSAYLVYGMPGQRFGGDVHMNSFGTEYRGCSFASGHAGPWYKYSYYYGGNSSTETVTDGIVAVSTIEDLSGDGRPEILFGLPYAEGWWDYHDDDPCDEDGRCYYDGMPNPLMTEEGNDDIGAWDYREGWVTETIDDVEYQYLCSNDNDLFNNTPLNQGYIIYLPSQNQMEDNVLDISLAGQFDPDPITTDEGTSMGSGAVPQGARLRGAWFSWGQLGQRGWELDFYNQFGRTLGSMPDLSSGGVDSRGDGRSELLISLPNSYQKRGSILLTWGIDLVGYVDQEVKSLPDYRKTNTDPCYRSVWYPPSREIYGAAPGDEFGYGNRAGDINRDGHQDILAGAPGADHDGAVDAGTVYVIYGRLDFGNLDLSQAVDPNDPNRLYIPRLEIRGTNTGDRFGEIHTMLGDADKDGRDDFAFASPLADGPGGADCGFIGIVFGDPKLTGENIFYVSDVGSKKLRGCAIYGSQRGGHAGHSIANVGDFNGDGYTDLLICAPNEVRSIRGQNRRGVAYLVFGGLHLDLSNNPNRAYYSLSEVGTEALPGIVFVSPYAQASADEATIDWVGAAGDVDGDGFADILLGVSEADFVNPLDPTQRRNDAGEVYLVYGNNSGTNVVNR